MRCFDLLKVKILSSTFIEPFIDISVAGDIVSCCTHMHKLCNLYLNVTRNSHFGGLAVKLINGRKYNDALK